MNNDTPTLLPSVLGTSQDFRRQSIEEMNNLMQKLYELPPQNNAEIIPNNVNNDFPQKTMNFHGTITDLSIDTSPAQFTHSTSLGLMESPTKFQPPPQQRAMSYDSGIYFQGNPPTFQPPCIPEVNFQAQQMQQQMQEQQLQAQQLQAQQLQAQQLQARQLQIQQLQTQQLPSQYYNSTPSPSQSSQQSIPSFQLEDSVSYANLEKELLGLINHEWDPNNNLNSMRNVPEAGIERKQTNSATFTPPDLPSPATTTSSPFLPSCGPKQQIPFSTDKPMGTVHLLLDPQGKNYITFVDNDLLDLFGYTSPQELLHRSFEILFPPPYREQLLIYVKNFLSPDSKPVGCATVEGVNKNGFIFPLQVNWAAHPPTPNQAPNTISLSMFLTSRSTYEGCVLVTDEGGNALAVSESVNIVGYEINDLLGKNINFFLPDLKFPLHDDYFGNPRNSICRNSDGKLQPICLLSERLQWSPFPGENINVMNHNNNLGKHYKFRVLPISENEAVYMTVTEAGHILTCSSGYTPLLLGFSANELVEKSLNVVFQPYQNQNQNHNNLSPGRREANEIQDVFDIFTHDNSNDLNNINNITRNNTINPVNVNVERNWWLRGGLGAVNVIANHKDGSKVIGILKVQQFNYYNVLYHALAFTRSFYIAPGNAQDMDFRVSERILNWQISEVISTGTFSRVVKGVDVSSKEKVAIKIMYKDLMQQNDKQAALREIEILCRLSHPNIARSYGIVNLPTSFCIVIEYLEGGNLSSYLEEKQRLSEHETKYLFKQLVDAVRYCHSQNVIHRDLKLTNIILDSSRRHLKLIDFGLSNFMVTGKFHSTFCGTPAFAAPEILLSQQYIGPEVDVWSLGVVLYNMVCGWLPFDSVKDIVDIRRKDIPADVSYECVDLIDSMLACSQKRTTADAIMRHRFFS